MSDDGKQTAENIRAFWDGVADLMVKHGIMFRAYACRKHDYEGLPLGVLVTLKSVGSPAYAVTEFIPERDSIMLDGGFVRLVEADVPDIPDGILDSARDEDGENKSD